MVSNWLHVGNFFYLQSWQIRKLTCTCCSIFTVLGVLMVLNCVEKIINLYLLDLFTWNLACLNWILFGKKYHKFDYFCLSWMTTKSATDSGSPNGGEWEGQRDNFWLIKIASKKTFHFRFDIFQKIITKVLKYNTGTIVVQKRCCKILKLNSKKREMGKRMVRKYQSNCPDKLGGVGHYHYRGLAVSVKCF